jgi:hypothetical protein
MSDNTRIVYVDRPRSSGCLWGCLGVLLLVSLPFIFAWSYGSWFLWQGFHDSPMMRTAIEMTERDSLARRVLGRPIIVTGMEGSAFSFVTGIGARNEFVLRLEGPRGEGRVTVSAHTEGREARIDALMLTGPDGQKYDLLHHAPLPSAGGDTTPI